MKPVMQSRAARLAFAAFPLVGAIADARADVITEFITESKLGTPRAIRVMAIAQTAAHGAVSGLDPAASASAAVAAAHRATLTKLLPAQQAAMGKQIGALVADRVLQPAIDPARSAVRSSRIEAATELMCDARGAAFFSCRP